MIKIPLSLLGLIHIRCPWQVKSVTFLPTEKNGTNAHGVSGYPSGNVRHYPHRSGGCGGPCDTPGGNDGGPPGDPYGSGSDSSSSELVRKYRHEQCSQQHDQFEQSVISLISLLPDLLQHKQRM